MESKYSEMIKVDLPRRLLVSILNNPFLFMATTGHFTVLRKLDNGNYMAALVYDGKEGKSKEEAYYGQIFPPSMIGSSVVYKGESFDKKIKINATVELSMTSKDNIINMSMEIEAEDKGLFGWGKSKFPVTAEHVIKNHVIPSMKSFSCIVREMNESLTVDPMDVAKYVLLKAKQIGNGLVVVHNQDVYAVFRVENSDIKESAGKFGNLLIKGNDVLIKLMQEKEKVIIETTGPETLHIMEVMKEINLPSISWKS